MRLLAVFVFLLSMVSVPVLAGPLDTPRPSPILGASASQGDFLPVDRAFRYDLVDTNDGKVLRFTIAEGYYLYQHQFKFHTEPEGLMDAPHLPPGESKTDPYFGDVVVYYGSLDIPLDLTAAKEQPLNLVITYQGCADKGLCYPPETRRIAVNGGIEAATTAGKPPSAPKAESTSPAAAGWSYRSLGAFFLAGLGLTFTPCVLPMLPILSGVVLRGAPGGRRALMLSAAYVLPMAACYALLGALMGVFGAGLNLQARLQSPWILIPFAVFFTAFALAMFGAFELRLPAALRDRLDRLAGTAKGGSVGGAATLGLLSSLLVSPCVSAPLAGALLYISTSGDAVGGALQLFALGLGMGTPLILFACGGGALLPRSGPWMLAVRNAFGVLLLAVAVWLIERVVPGPIALALWGTLAVGTALFLGTLELNIKSPRQKLAQLAGLALLVYGACAWFGALSGQSDPLRPLGETRTPAGQHALLDWKTISEPAELDALLADARQAREPVFLDWYADWCISCKVMEREVLPKPAVQDALKPYRRVRFDVTRSDEAQRALLDRFGLFGPPSMQFFDVRGREVLDQRIIGETTADELARRLVAVTRD